MKTIIFLTATAIFTFLVATKPAGPASKDHGDKYCAKMKDGMLVVMHQGNTLTTDVTLDNGTMIKTDGTVIKKDGSRMMMKEGECVNKSGKIKDMKDSKSKEDKDKKNY